LSNVYPGLESEEFNNASAGLKKKVDAFDRYLDDHQVSRTSPRKPIADVRAIIEEYLSETNSTSRLYSTLNAYVASFVTTDSFNTLARRLESEFETVGTQLRKQEIRFQGWIGTVAEFLPKIIDESSLARDHSFHLNELADQSKYMMSEPEELLAAELDLSGGNAWGKLQGTVTSQLTVDFELEGKIQKLPITALQNLNHHKDADTRRRAYEAELAAWESVRESLAGALNGVKGSVLTVDKRRGRIDAIHASLDFARIDRETLETLLGVMRNSFPMFR